ncbi:MAG: hypothetical protein QME71_04035 [Dehalococcoidia bacterium]|nr:hypothetical protein [Dehalococcoidia bacterium]
MRRLLRRPGPSRSRGFALLLGVSLAAALLLAGGATVLGLRSASGGGSSGDTTPAPPQLAGRKLMQVVTGAEAMAEVDRLHGKGLDIVDAWIGRYEGGGTVWVAEAASEDGAFALLDAMVRAIEDGGSPYQGLTQNKFEGMPMYAARDANGHHFFFQAKTRVVWVATPPGAEQAFLSEALANLR